jgi:hypothetical protein
MRIRKLTRTRVLAGSIGAVAVAATMVFAMAGSGAAANASARNVKHLRPHALTRSGIYNTPSGITAFSQQFATNTNYFCPGLGNQPCDGNPNPNPVYSDYGTIDRVSSGYNNGGYGNYAPETHALTGQWMAVVSGDADGNQGLGCPQPGIGEYCSGPYALFGYGDYGTFPSNGFTVTDDLYLSPSSASANGTLVDDDVELNNNTGGYGIDNTITACWTNGSFGVSFSNGSPGPCNLTPAITADGWYRFVFDFSNNAGNAYLTETVLSESPGHAVEATTGPLPVGGTVTPIYQWGGPGYFWLPTEDISGLPLANFALQLGQHSTGHTP